MDNIGDIASRAIRSDEEHMLAIAERLCAVYSVAGERSGDDAPFGDGCRRALDEALSICREEGFAVHDDAGYACHAEIGGGSEIIGIMAHLDTVPAGDGWTSDPTKLTERGGKLYARGIVDNKGPAAAAIYAMSTIKKLGIPLKRRVRLILGCSEEDGMEDLAHYFAGNEKPLWAFTPDASFPVINCEKHILHVTLKKQIGRGAIESITAGERFNVVPETAEAVFYDDIPESAKKLALDYGKRFGVAVEATDRSIKVRGAAAHASHPDLGVNAAAHLLFIIKECGLATGDEKTAINDICESVGLETDGASLGMASKDRESGSLTNNMGMVRLGNGEFSASFDMRCPVTMTYDELISRLEKKASDMGFTYEIPHWAEGILVPEDSELVQTLLSVYNEETGQNAKPLAIGGGTYARELRNRAVAFGPCFPDKEDMCHQRDEYIEREDLLTLAVLIAKALIRLAA